MLTLEMLYAVLQGLPPSYLTFLDVSWDVFCKRIETALNAGHDPASALTLALEQAMYWEIEIIKKTLIEVLPVMQIPDLSRRQKEALIALRFSKVASLAQLSGVLADDRSNVHKRLKVLVNKGFAIKFFKRDGVHYYAVRTPLDKTVKLEVNRIINELIGKFSPASSTMITTATKATTATTGTKSPTLTTPTT